MKPLSRRSVTTAIPAMGLSASATMAKGGPSELAALVRRYLQQIDYFNSSARAVTGEYRSDEESDALAAATFEATLDDMLDVPVRSNEDALAVIELLLREDALQVWVPAKSFAESLRDYLAERVRS